MSDWTWEYVPDAANVVGSLTPEQIAEVEALAVRLADAVGVRRIGTPFDPEEAVSNLLAALAEWEPLRAEAWRLRDEMDRSPDKEAATAGL